MLAIRDRSNQINLFLSGYQSLFDIYENEKYPNLLDEINQFIATNIEDIIFAILVRESIVLKSYEAPIFSNFDDCSINMCVSLDSLKNKGIEMTELGELLLQKNAKDSALYKYGESHFKTAQILGLACKGEQKGAMKAYLTNIGYYYLQNEDKRSRLMSRLLLRSKMIQKLLKESLNKEYKVYECMNMLSKKTINRRLPNVRRVVQELLNSDEHDFSEFIDNLDFESVEIEK